MNAARTVACSLDLVRFNAIAEFANLASSYWRSIEEAATRGEALTLHVHCRQVSAVTKEAFATVKMLGSTLDAGRDEQ